MGVYNPLVDMPETCDLCFVYGKCGLWLDCENSTERRHPCCPLVEVKAPHGDLIDRDKVIEEMCVKYTKAERQKKLMYASVEVKQGFCDLLTVAPTVLEAEGKDDG